MTQAPSIKEALERLIADIEDYERVNNLAPSPGKKDCWQSVTNAKAALATFQPDGERREAIARIIDPHAFIIVNPKRVDMMDRQRWAREKADSILASGFVQNEAGIRDGYVLVPIVPTQEMLDAGYWPCVQRRGAKSVWAAMIAAIRSARDGGAS